MCCPASFVLTKSRVFWSMTTDSHTKIIAEHGLHEDGAHGVNVVKVEISPADGQLDSDPGTWVYKLDQDFRPDWYDAEVCERRARVALKDWVAKRVVASDLSELKDRGLYFVTQGATVAKLCGSAVVESLHGTVENVRGSGTVENVRDSGTVKNVWDSGTVSKRSRVATVAEPSSPMAVVIDRTGQKAVCLVRAEAV